MLKDVYHLQPINTIKEENHNAKKEVNQPHK